MKSDARDRSWRLAWPHGELIVYAIGGMLGGVRLRVGDSWIAPFYEPPWHTEQGIFQPPLLGNMRSEFGCVPFGVPYGAESVTDEWSGSLRTDPAADLDATDNILHGYGSIANWDLVHLTQDEIRICVDYPVSSVVRRLERTIRCDRHAPAIEFSLKIEVRKRAKRPVGVHPTLALPKRPGLLHIKSCNFRLGFCHPAGPEPGISRAKPGGVFTRLSEVPLVSGGVASFTQFPLTYNTEEILQLCGTDGLAEFVNAEIGAAYTLTWDADALPSLLLWISNRGRAYAPWNSRNICLGVEPMVGAFELGCTASLAKNPMAREGIATALVLEPEHPTTIAYRFAARRLARDYV